MSDNPLTKPDIQLCRRHCAQLKECQDKLERAKRAGLPTDEIEIRCDHMRSRYAKLVEEYGE
jgi:hypothetical protein